MNIKKGLKIIKDNIINFKSSFSGVDLNSSVDNQYYVQAQKEIAEKSYDEAIMIKCKVAANGDESKANAIYVKHRVNELKEDAFAIIEKNLKKINDFKNYEEGISTRLIESLQKSEDDIYQDIHQFLKIFGGKIIDENKISFQKQFNLDIENQRDLLSGKITKPNISKPIIDSFLFNSYKFGLIVKDDNYFNFSKKTWKKLTEEEKEIFIYYFQMTLASQNHLSSIPKTFGVMNGAELVSMNMISSSAVKMHNEISLITFFKFFSNLEFFEDPVNSYFINEWREEQNEDFKALHLSN